MKDKELQTRIEEGDHLDTSADAEAYRKVFSSLQREMDFSLSSSFEDLVIQRIAAQHAKESYRDGWWFIGGIVLFLMGFVVALVLIDFRPSVGVYTFVTGYPGLIAFGITFILILNYIDKKFIRPVAH
jgi:hypothetical protein